MPGRRTAIAGLVLLAAMGAACEPPTTPIPPAEKRLLVHAVIDASTAETRVFLERTESGAFGTIDDVKGATVRITAPWGAIYEGSQEVEDPTCQDCLLTEYYAVPLGRDNIVLGATYTLLIETPEGETVTATTTVPGTPGDAVAIGEVQAGTFRRDTDTLRLAWPRMAGAAKYQLAIRSVFMDQNFPIEFNTRHRTFVDTSIAVAGTAKTFDNDDLFRRNSQVVVAIAAVDANYYAYYQPTSDPFAGAPPSRIKGALGVFGAVVPIVRRQYSKVE